MVSRHFICCTASSDKERLWEGRAPCYWVGCEKYIDTADSREGELKRGGKSDGAYDTLKTRLHVRVGKRESQTNRRGERK